jgi:hypothetical protein
MYLAGLSNFILGTARLAPALRPSNARSAGASASPHSPAKRVLPKRSGAPAIPL